MSAFQWLPPLQNKAFVSSASMHHQTKVKSTPSIFFNHSKSPTTVPIALFSSIVNFDKEKCKLSSITVISKVFLKFLTLYLLFDTYFIITFVSKSKDAFYF
jgi:hypothetical protein